MTSSFSHHMLSAHRARAARRLIALAALLGLALGSTPPAVGQAQTSANIRAVDLSQFPEVRFDFQAADAAGRRIAALAAADVAVIEDGAAPLGLLELNAQSADGATPMRIVPLVAPSPTRETTLELAAVGAAIGIVFDNTLLLNPPGGHEADFRSAGQRAIETFLMQPSRAPGDPEILGLFTPISGRGQQIMAPTQPTFTADHAALSAALSATAPRTGKTQLYAAIDQAIAETAAAARASSRPAALLVVADGSDVLSARSYDAALDRARREEVRIIAFGIGADAALDSPSAGQRLRRLAVETGGVYLRRPDEAAIAAAFREHVPSLADTLFTARYRSQLPVDSAPHHFVVQIRTDGGTVLSQQVAVGTAAPTRRAASAMLLRSAGMVVVPVALLVALVVKLALERARKRTLSRVQTLQ